MNDDGVHKLEYAQPTEREGVTVPEWVKMLGVVFVIILTLGFLYFVLQVLPRYP